MSCWYSPYEAHVLRKQEPYKGFVLAARHRVTAATGRSPLPKMPRQEQAWESREGPSGMAMMEITGIYFSLFANVLWGLDKYRQFPLLVVVL